MRKLCNIFLIFCQVARLYSKLVPACCRQQYKYCLPLPVTFTHEYTWILGS